MGEYAVRTCLDSQGFQVVIVGAGMIEPSLLTVRILSRNEGVVSGVLRAMSVRLDRLADLAAGGKLQDATSDEDTIKVRIGGDPAEV